MKVKSNYKTIKRQRQRIELARAHILKSLDSSISLQQIAELGYYSPVHFQAIFSENMGETLSEYVLRNRLFLAERRLVETHEKLNDIAFLCGFSNQANFTRAFKHKFDISPARYRKKYYNNNRAMLNLKLKPNRRVNKEPVIEDIPSSMLLGVAAKGYMSLEYDYTLWAAVTELCKKAAMLEGINPWSEKPMLVADDVTDLTRLNTGKKIAAMRVDRNLIAPELRPDIFEFKGGKYAIFKHQGVLPEQTLNIGLFDWLPNSNYEIDLRRPVFMQSSQLTLSDFNVATQTRLIKPLQCVITDGMKLNLGEIESVQVDIYMPVKDRDTLLLLALGVC